MKNRNENEIEKIESALGIEKGNEMKMKLTIEI
jgi:hypothetical protein